MQLKDVKSSAIAFDKRIKFHLNNDMVTTHIPKIQEMILNEYDSKLVGVVSDRKSRTNPVYYKEDFLGAVKEFDYLPKPDVSEEVTIRVPDIINFPFNYKKLAIIKSILEGIVGTYAEVSEDQYVAMFAKRPINEQVYDNTVPTKERIYLLKYTAELQRREVAAFKTRILTRYPFSNTPPIDIFTAADEYVKNNLKKWLDSAMQKALEDLN